MDVKILQLIEGAKKARGLAVIIDVFRAFTVEAYFLSRGASCVIPVADVETAFKFKEKHPDAILCGERGGAKIEGFDYGNSPSEIENGDFSGRTVVHTTSAGTQGVANATDADEIIGGSLVCAKAIAEYAKRQDPKQISLVCMGLAGKEPTDEDTLAAEYIKSIIDGASLPDIRERIEGLKKTDGAKFFDEKYRSVFPTRDFELSTRVNCFPFVIRLRQGGPEGLAYMERYNVLDLPRPLPKGKPTEVKTGARLSDFTPDEAGLFPNSVKALVAYGHYTEPQGNFDAALVLGGQSEYIESRARSAARLYHSGRCPLFITTGGVFRETRYGFISEADALRRYMIDLDVPSDCIMLEEAAATTRENMRYSRALIDEKCAKTRPRIAVITSFFHTRRASALAKAYINDADIFGFNSVFPNDSPEDFYKDPILCEAVTKECCCLCSYVKSGLTEDFKIE